MQELKAYNVVATADVNPDVVDNLGCTEFAAYDADEVDAEIAQLKDKLQAAEKQIENLINSALSLMLGQDTANDKLDAENRSLKRALWLLKARYFWILMVYASDLSKVANPSIIHKSNFLENPTPRCMEEYQHEAGLYDNARIKCLAKAKKYTRAEK